MSIQAHQLLYNDIQLRAVKQYANRILHEIDADIKTAFEGGAKHISFGTPLYFEIPNMTNADAQREIYYCILRSLLDRKFTVKHELTKDKSMFHITWISDDKQKVIEAQESLLKKYRM